MTENFPNIHSFIPETAIRIANHFINFSKQDQEQVPVLDQMKLQKLIFYSYAWYAAYFPGKMLFAQDIEAWPYGPVVHDVYTQTKTSGLNRISSLLHEYTIIDGEIAITKPEGARDSNVKLLLADIWAKNKHLSGVQLSNATHAKGEPWTAINDIYDGDLSGRPTIPVELISDIFRKKMEQSAA